MTRPYQDSTIARHGQRKRAAGRRSDSAVANPKAMRGLTLVELMVALTIALIILAAMAQLFATSRSTYSLEEGMARQQESGRFALDMLAYDIRMAGFAGCANLDPSQVHNNIVGADKQVTYDKLAQFGMEGFQYTGSGADVVADWTPSLPAPYFSPSDKIQPGSDVILIKYATANGAVNLVQSDSVITIPGENNGLFKKDDVLMITDCKQADIFIASDVSPPSGGVITIRHDDTNGNEDNIFGRPGFDPNVYNAGAELMKFHARVYFIKDGASGEPSLFRREVGDNGNLVDVELVEGIEAIKMAYGILEPTASPTMSGPNRYVGASAVPTSVDTGWPRVRSVQVGVVARTIAQVNQTEDFSSPSAHIDVLGDDQSAIDDFKPPQDRRQRQAYSMTVFKRKPPG